MILTVLIVYVLAMLAIGFWANRYNKDMTDFLLAGRRLGLVLATATLTATYFGGGYVLGLGEYAYVHGWIAIWQAIGGGVGFILVGFMAYRMRELAFFTVPDYLSYRYGGNEVRVLSALLSLVALVGILGAQVLACRSALGIVGVGNSLGLVLSPLIFVAYTAVGGLWAVTLTDFVQVLVASIGVFAAAIFVLNYLGGYGAMVGKVTAQGLAGPHFFELFGGDVPLAMWLMIPMAMYTLIGQDVYQRIFAAKDAKTSRASCVLSGILITVICLFPVLIGLSARALFPDLTQSGEAVPRVITTMFHPIFAGLVLAAVLAAIMSTADSILSAGVSHIIKDFYIETLHRSSSGEQDQKKLLSLSRLWTVILGIGSIAFATAVPRIVDILTYSYFLYTGGVFVPVVGGILWKNATREGAIAGIVVGALTAVIGIVAHLQMWGIPMEIYTSVFSAVAFVIVSLATQKQKVSARMEGA